MITRQELKELASIASRDSLFASLYLNVDPKENPKNDWQLHFKNLARSAVVKLPADLRPHAQKDVDYIEAYLNDRPDGLRRGLAVFSNVDSGYWRVFNTMVAFPNQLVITRDPFIKPLVAMIDIYQRYLVLVVGVTKARLLITSLGEIEEFTSIYKPLESGEAARDGSVYGFGDLRAQRSREKIERIVHKDALAATERLLVEEGIKRILLGGTDGGRGRFKEAMPALTRERVVGEFAVDRNAGDHEILEQLIPVMKEVEYKFERKAINELFDNANNRSVFGLSDVLTALQQGNVHKIFVLNNFTLPGMSCRRCGALTPERDRPCPYCGEVMERVPYMLDTAIQKAIEQGARVDMLEHAPRLHEIGGIAALLRY
ncbi:MAG: hypothetical protein V2A61_07765 [Calditrichota bacterium]